MKDHSRQYFLVWLGLMAFFGLTVACSFLDLGVGNEGLALGLAVTKMALVAGFYMHLREAPGRTRLFAGAAFLWLVLLFGLTLADALSRSRLGPLQGPFLFP